MSLLRITGVFELIPEDLCLMVTFGAVFLDCFLCQKKIMQHTVENMAVTSKNPLSISAVTNSNRWEENLEDNAQFTKHSTDF